MTYKEKILLDKIMEEYFREEAEEGFKKILVEVALEFHEKSEK